MKTISSFKRQPENYSSVLGIDSSTQGVAWTYFNALGPVASGKIHLEKIKDIQDRNAEIAKYLPEIIGQYNPGLIYCEMPIFVKNPDTARKLSFVVGAILTVAAWEGKRVELREPATWKAHIGYFNLSSKFSAECKRVLGATEGKKLCDVLRKSQTMRIINHKFPEFDTSDHDISDSCAIAIYGWHEAIEPILFEKNKEIAFDLPHLASLGLTV